MVKIFPHCLVPQSPVHALPDSGELPLWLCCVESRKRKHSMTACGQGLHPDFAWRQVDGRSLGLVAARAICVLLGLWC